jgi:CHAD domain-containing protein
MKARRVKDLDPDAPLAENVERIVRVRLAELTSFMPRATDPAEVEALHDMRIAAKRLRYILEVTAPCFGEYATAAVRATKDLQDLLGEIHDCDMQLPDVRRRLARVVVEDARALVSAAGDASDLEPALLREAPHRDRYAGLVAYSAYLQARRDLLFHRFLELWTDLERKGFTARLEYALTERVA